MLHLGNKHAIGWVSYRNNCIQDNLNTNTLFGGSATQNNTGYKHSAT